MIKVMIGNPLKQLGDLNKMRKQANIIQKMLAEEEVVVEKNGVKVVMSGDQKIKSLTIDGEQAGRVKKAVEKAIEKSQKIAAGKLGSLSGMFG